MPNVSGKVIFNTTSNGDATDFRNGVVRNTPITLLNTITNVGVTAFTNNNGVYQFTNVPNGPYLIVESSSSTSPVNSIVDFSTATVIPNPIPGDPPIAFATVATEGSLLNSLSPNSKFILVIGNLTDVDFIDAPILDIDFPHQDFIINSSNLITLCDNGTFGTLPSTSTNIMQQNPPNNAAITAEHYTITNVIVSSPSWWGIADHTTRDETGKMLLVLGEYPTRTFFTQTISVTPNTNYFFSTWISNLTRDKLSIVPKLEFTVENSYGTKIFTKTIQSEIEPKTIPAWFQVASLFNSSNSNGITITFTFIGMPSVNVGFLIDDISLHEVILTPQVISRKTVDKNFALPGDTLTYSFSIKNNGPQSITELLFTDSIPQNTTFIPDSFFVNGINMPNPSTPNKITYIDKPIHSGEFSSAYYKIKISDTIPNGSLIKNQSSCSITFVNSKGATDQKTIISNLVTTKISICLLTLTISVDKTSCKLNELLRYTITILNKGPITANNVTLIDYLPQSLYFIPNSCTIGNRKVSGIPNLSCFNLGILQPNQVITIYFDTKVKSKARSNQIIHFCRVLYSSIINPHYTNCINSQLDSNVVSTILIKKT